MLRLLRTFLGKSPDRSRYTSARRLGLKLAAIEGALVEEKHFPRPKWKIIHAWIKEHVAEDDIEIAWHELAFDWVSTLQKHLGYDYAIHQSSTFILLTSRGVNSGKSILRTSELAVQYLVNWLGPVAKKRGHGKHIILDFVTEENYYDYVSYYYPPDSPLIASGGIFFHSGYQHIALPPMKNMQDTLIHELAHNRLAHLPLPKWLNEGIAVTMERKIGGNKHGQIDRDLHKKHLDYWTSQTIQAFWRGDSFGDMDGEVIHLSYSLAETLVDLLVQEFPNFLEFVSEANWEDAGQTALHKYFDIHLIDLASTFLGPGNWSPAK